MKNKFIPFLISILLFTQTVFGASIYDEWLAGGEVVDVEVNPEYAEAINELKAIGVTENLGFALSENAFMTRGEFISLVMNIELELENAEDVHDAVFSDVPSESTFAKGIYTALDMGIISGSGNGNFEPYEPINYSSAIKILVSILGYQIPAEESGGFPTGYMKQAARADLNVITPNDYSALTMGEAAFLVLNALNTEVMEAQSIGTTNKLSAVKDLTWLKRSKNIVQLEGIVEANKYSGIYNITNMKKDHVRIDGEIYKTDFAFDSLLGMNVKYYLENDETVIFAKPYGNTVRTISSEDISGINGRTLSYYSNGKKKSVDIPKGIAVIYNNVAYPDYTMELFNVKNGTVELIKSSSGDWNAAKINDWIPVFVNSVDVRERKMSVSMFDNSKPGKIIAKSIISYADYDVVEIYNSDGEMVDFDDVAEKTLVNVLFSKNNSALVGYIGKKAESGAVQEKFSSVNSPSFSMNSYKIELSPCAMFKTDELDIGDAVTVYFDNFGKAAYIEESGQANVKYGYLVDIALAKGLESGLLFRIYDDGKEVRELKTDDVFYLNDTRITKFAQIPEVLSKETVILYEASTKGLVRRIYTPDTAGSPLVKIADEAERLFYPGSTNYVFSSESTTAFTSGFCVDENSILLAIPNDAKTAENDDFSVLSPSTFSIFDRRTVSAYTQNTDSNVAELVLEKGGDASEVTLTNAAMVVVEIRKALNEEGEEVHTLTLNGKNVKDKKYYTSDSDVAAKVDVGDIIMPSTDLSGIIRKIRIIVDREKENEDGTISEIVPDKTVQLNLRWYANCSIFEGYVYSIKDGTVRFAQRDTLPENVTTFNSLTFKLKNLPVIEVEPGDKLNVVEEINADYLSSYEDNNIVVNAILYVRSGTPQMLVLYK